MLEIGERRTAIYSLENEQLKERLRAMGVVPCTDIAIDRELPVERYAVGLRQFEGRTAA